MPRLPGGRGSRGPGLPNVEFVLGLRSRGPAAGRCHSYYDALSLSSWNFRIYTAMVLQGSRMGRGARIDGPETTWSDLILMINYSRAVGGSGFLKRSRETVCACNAGYLHCYCTTRWESNKFMYVATAITTTATVAWIYRGFVVPDVDCSELPTLVTRSDALAVVVGGPEPSVSSNVMLPALQSGVKHGQTVPSTCRPNPW